MEVKVTAEFDNIETIKRAVDEAAGIAILPEPTLRREVERGTLAQTRLLLRVDEPPFVRPLSIVHRRKRRLKPAVTEFIKLLQNDAHESVAELKPTKIAIAEHRRTSEHTPPPGEPLERAAMDARRTTP